MKFHSLLKKEEGPIRTGISLVPYSPPCPSSSSSSFSSSSSSSFFLYSFSYFLPFSLSCKPWFAAVQAAPEYTRHTGELFVLSNLDTHDPGLRQRLMRPECRTWAHGLVSFPTCFLHRRLSSPATNHCGLLGSSSTSRPCPFERWNATFSMTHNCAIHRFLDFFRSNRALFWGNDIKFVLVMKNTSIWYILPMFDSVCKKITFFETSCENY